MIRYCKVEAFEELMRKHFAIYNPCHGKKDAWLYEYDSTDEARADGYTDETIIAAINKGDVFILQEGNNGI